VKRAAPELDRTPAQKTLSGKEARYFFFLVAFLTAFFTAFLTAFFFAAMLLPPRFLDTARHFCDQTRAVSR
jgi:hypothetical protein